ncbi:MAG: AzlD domain-containing protein [Lachnospiraceae bacterium]|nr:AzlD domain-containing protein [Lachnospiraceae bacterium]
MISTGRAIIIIAVAAVCTIITRAIPFIFFGGKKEIPKRVLYLGKVLPPAVIGTLIVYCLKGVNVTTAPYGIEEFISVALVAVLHAWKRNTFLSIGAGTACYMVLIQFVI